MDIEVSHFSQGSLFSISFQAYSVSGLLPDFFESIQNTHFSNEIDHGWFMKVQGGFFEELLVDTFDSHPEFCRSLLVQRRQKLQCLWTDLLDLLFSGIAIGFLVRIELLSKLADLGPQRILFLSVLPSIGMRAKTGKEAAQKQCCCECSHGACSLDETVLWVWGLSLLRISS